ncbi:MAG: hypothetical protein HC834_04335 [Rhodospirillales bacterium]|nr:hypothetical protein [Rhodospirillales bacterium]
MGTASRGVQNVFAAGSSVFPTSPRSPGLNGSDAASVQVVASRQSKGSVEAGGEGARMVRAMLALGAPGRSA